MQQQSAQVATSLQRSVRSLRRRCSGSLGSRQRHRSHVWRYLRRDRRQRRVQRFGLVRGSASGSTRTRMSRSGRARTRRCRSKMCNSLAPTRQRLRPIRRRAARRSRRISSVRLRMPRGRRDFQARLRSAGEIRNVLSRFSGARPVQVARALDGRPYVPCTIRRLVDGKQIGIHHDYHYRLDLYRELSTQVDTTTLISHVATLRARAVGRRTFRLWRDLGRPRRAETAQRVLRTTSKRSKSATTARAS